MEGVLTYLLADINREVGGGGGEIRWLADVERGVNITGCQYDTSALQRSDHSRLFNPAKYGRRTLEI